MRLRSAGVGEWPIGVHWTPGEVKRIEIESYDELPVWLVPVEDDEAEANSGQE